MPDAVHSGSNQGVHVRPRFWYTTITLLVTTVLIGWGGFVTSIDAGLAVPDWPSSFNSYDPFNPWPEWWTLTPVLAEHGHRLLGALVGILTIGLALWTWFADSRRWMRILGIVALVLVSAQGALGGLRVVWVSLNLAVVHACVAQLFFALVACMALFTSRSWENGTTARSRSDLDRAHRLTLITAAVIYLQIILGALLRHPGTGIDATLATFHIAGATAVTVLIAILFFRWRPTFGNTTPGRMMGVLGGAVLAQVALGLTAYLVLLDERGMIVPSNLQVVVNTAHLIFGAVLFSSIVVKVASIARLRYAPAREAAPAPSAPSYHIA